jgi:hypothetical protein
VRLARALAKRRCQADPPRRTVDEP